MTLPAGVALRTPIHLPHRRTANEAQGHGSEHRDVDRFDTVVIDPGHGGDDQGAVGPSGRMEKDVVLDVAKRLAAKLRDDRLLVVMTRESDVYLPLAARTAAANAGHGG